jgi:glycosyltransferase involved in cell wall biosynthesis
MAVYQRDDLTLFERAVHSVYANTILPNAFVLVVDGPVPEALDAVILGLQDKYGMDVLRLSVNSGLSHALNAGLKRIRTKWVVRADSDDYNLPNRFALQAIAVNHSNDSIGLLGGAIQEVDSSGRHIAVRRTVERHLDILSFVSYRNPFNHMTVAFKTDLALSCGGYPDIYLKEDYALWAKMISVGAQTLNLSDILVHATTGREMYRRRGGLRYALAEISLQRYLVRARLKSSSMALMQGLSRAFIFLLPSSIRGWIYEKILRTSL